MPLFMLNPMWILFGQLLDKILLLFIPTSGHIDARVGFAGGRFDATLTISLNHTHLPSLSHSPSPTLSQFCGKSFQQLREEVFLFRMFSTFQHLCKNRFLRSDKSATFCENQISVDSQATSCELLLLLLFLLW